MAQASDWGADSSHPNEMRHTYEHDEDGTEQTLVADERHVTVEEAAEELGIDPQQWSWVLSEGNAVGGGVAPTAYPCSTCGDPIWGSRQSAERNRGKGTARCGECVRAEGK